jgi:DNA-directed RNA polymerase subunit K/omega
MESRYEHVALLSMRTAQLEKGAHAYVQVHDPTTVTAEQVALMEIKAGVCPLVIRRTLPGGRIVYLNHNTTKDV